MGGRWTKTYFTETEYMPTYDTEPTFDPQIGFKTERKERVMIATKEEMESVGVPKEQQDYCAHKYIEFLACKEEVKPFFQQCAHQKHAYQTCLAEDYYLRMKEYERERRLLQREKRRAMKEE